MSSLPDTLALDPLRALSLELPRLDGAVRRATLRGLLALSAGTIRVEGADRLAAAPEPSIFALTHHNAWEAVLAPATLIALRRGRLVRFLVDWMFVDLPWTGWLVRQSEPIPVYTKAALFRLREAHRLARRRDSALRRALDALGRGEDVGVYPEGRRNPDPWRLSHARRGLALLALRSGVPVVPVGIDFPARDRLRRTPKAGRFALRVGDPLDVSAEHASWLSARGEEDRRTVEREAAPALLDRVCRELARLSRKVHLAAPGTATGPAVRLAEPAAVERMTTEKVDSPAARTAVLTILEEVYRKEKGWLRDVGAEIPADPAADAAHTWFVVRAGDEPVGAVRLAWDPPLELPAEMGVELDAGVDLRRLAGAGRFVEIGRLMIRDAWRTRPALVLELMRAAIREVVERGYTHLFTVVFEDDPHSPYRFHTRVLGFERIGTHQRGELACASRRILLVLDIARAWERLRSRRARLATQLTLGLEERLASLSRRAPRTPAGTASTGPDSAPEIQ